MRWLYTGGSYKTPDELSRLIREVFMAPEYCREHLDGFDAARENQKLDKFLAMSSAFSADDGWRQASVEISLPKEGVSHPSEEAAPKFKVENIFLRSLSEVMKAGYQDIRASRFHMFPFRLFWQRRPSSPGMPPPPPMQLWSDTYNSDAMIEEHEKIQEKARVDREPGDADDVEYVVAPILLYSDSTHLASFGTAALWPIYSFFGALTKYIRCRPNAFAAHHLAYIPSLPATIQKAYQDIYGTPASVATLRLCKRDLMQQIWHLLLDEEFIKAYVHGMLVKCGDGITRRLFPRIPQYSADYPEKCLIACIKHLAGFPCPACLMPKDDIDKMGTVNDMKNRTRLRRTLAHNRYVSEIVKSARKKIFEQGAAPEGATVDDALKLTSITSSRSAFADKLAEFGLNVYDLLVPDLMHEFELGVWKAVFTHLVRVLIAAGGDRVQEMDRRFSLMPTFGRDTIRRFGANMSAMKKLAARDFEDILQCSYFAFEGLLDPPYNDYVLKLIFMLATWHSLAKLRLHSEDTLTFFEQITKMLGTAMRAFERHVCSAFDTKELPSETMARQRRAAAKRKKAPARSAKRRKFNGMHTYKYHRLGDYPASIRRHGTTDNTSTQPGELEHKRVKRFYALTNKNVKFAWQIARLQRRQQYLNREGLPDIASKKTKRKKRQQRACYVPFTAEEPLAPSSPKEHTQISEEQAASVHIPSLIAENNDDPSFTSFRTMLDVHLFQRLEALAGRSTTREPTVQERRTLRVDKDVLWLHKVMRVNWTSYDMRREQSSVNPRTHPEIMMLAPSGSSHPYLYARVVAIFHVNTFVADAQAMMQPEPRLLQVLWVRWYDLDTSRPGGFEYCRPHRLKFAALDDKPFGFISPEQVLRDVHIVPAPYYGRADTPSLPYRVVQRTARRRTVDEADESDEQLLKQDYKFYYVAMWSDRDLFMRFLGGGVGHEEHQDDEGIPAMEIDEEMAEEGSSHTAAAPREDEVVSDEEEPEGAYVPSEDEGDDEEEYEEDEDRDGNGEEEEEEEEEPDLGPEDGEADEEVDEYELDNYAPY
ncbi:hypothetical protein K466DRAFT_645664 [Polyporus arcularius HHB13444]|uniref:Uncharacterized protein n=1 Tax=Polyporus arcularius HHB13444 TaxID=1314778 RepID=A0A5C3PEJ3_9APHY|nr:hypothetical protein K466DRAFT_645664 [Polyporus arcularius HHB13444]